MDGWIDILRFNMEAILFESASWETNLDDGIPFVTVVYVGRTMARWRNVFNRNKYFEVWR